MKIAFDTSVVVAASNKTHPNHREAARWIESAKTGRCDAFLCQHGLSEAYAVMTRIPQPLRVPPASALSLLHELSQFVRVTPLSPDDYFSAIQRSAAHGLIGGALYDCLHLVCAESNGCDKLITDNVKHFERFLQLRPIEIVPL